MGFRVQEEDPSKVQEEAVSVLSATRTTRIDEQRMRWLYSSNPDGPATFWSIRKEETGQMAGFTVCLPRRMIVNGVETICWNGADFSILPQFRALGVAIKLRRAAKTAIDEGRVAFLYSHPNAKMQVIHERVGHFPIGEMVRYAKPLRTAPYLERRMPSWLARLGGAMADPWATYTRKERRHRSESEIKVRDDLRFDDRYDRLFADVSPKRPLLGVRDSRYLKWRYETNPLKEYGVAEATQNEHLSGYMTFHSEDKTLQICDVFARDPGTAMDLLIAVIRWARSAFHTVSFTLLENSTEISLLEELGFRRREDKSNMFGYAPAESKLAELIRSSSNWRITVGDRDV